VASGGTLHEIKRLAGLGRIRLSWHAQVERMPERGVALADIQSALVTATAANWQADHGTFKVTGGVDTDSDELAVCCTVDPDVEVFVTTIF
jgi:hypothetical protein